MADQNPDVVVLLPVYNDWEALALLLPRLMENWPLGGGTVAILVVDDGSTEGPGRRLSLPGRTPLWIRVLRLRRNCGHQRAIAIGLSYISEHLPGTSVLVMDADGEDRPEDVGALLRRCEEEAGHRIVFAERRRRAETLTFRFFYRVYRLIHQMLTGTGVRVGNFSVIPAERLASIVVVSELWIHYAASVFRSRQPVALVPTQRGRRLDGQSRMNFVSLVVHGLSAISVYSDIVFTRLVVANAAVIVSSVFLLAVAVGVRLLTTLAVPGWATYVAGFLLVILLQAVMFGAALTFQVLGARQQLTVVPQRDYGLYVDSVRDFSFSSGLA